MVLYSHRLQTHDIDEDHNVKFTAIATYADGSMSNCRACATEKAMSNWANKQYNKDEGCTVTVWVGYTDTVYCTYHA